MSTSSQISEDSLFNRFQCYFDTKLDNLKRELVLEQDAASEKLTKKLKTSDYTFKKKGHKKQTDFNNELKEKLENADNALTKVPPNVEKAREELRDGKQLVDNRNKLIRIADTSEAGWAAVDEYLENEVADDSDDDKRIKKAQYAAIRKQKNRKTKLPQQIKTVVSGAGGSTGNFRRFDWRRGQNMLHPNDSCFFCGEIGHWRRECRKFNNTGSNAGSLSSGVGKVQQGN